MRVLRKLEVAIRIIIWAITQLKNPTSYDYVMYKGERCWIKYGNPNWKLYGVKKQVDAKDFELIRSVKRDWDVFKQRYKFQMGYWFSIDFRNPLFTRLSYNTSDDIHFQNK